MPVQHARSPGQAQCASFPNKNHVTSKSPVGDISVVTLIRTDTTLDHSQKAEKVWRLMEQSWVSVRQQLNNVLYFLLLMAGGGEVLEDILGSMANDAACSDAEGVLGCESAG